MDPNKKMKPKKKPQKVWRVKEKNKGSTEVKQRSKKQNNQTRSPGVQTANLRPSAVQGTGSLAIPTLMSTNELTYAAATYLSYVFYKNVINSSNLNFFNVVRGMSALTDAVIDVTSGGVLAITQVPKIYDVMIQLLRSKKLKLMGGTINYTPQWNSAYGLPFAFNTRTGAVYTFTPPTNNLLVDFTYNPVGSDSNSYAEFLKTTDDSFSAFGATLVEPLVNKGMYSVDPSAFARNYTYFGAAGATVGGYYSDTELEVPFNYTLFSKFVKYDTDDKVVSKVFHPQSGGICTPIGLSLAGEMNNSLLKNPIPVIYKFIDFYQLYAVLGSWISTLWTQVPAGFQGSPNNPYTTPTQFSFGVKDFQWLLRQAVLSIFPEQCHAQFVAPVEAVPSQNNSVFQPFIVDGILASNPDFSSMLMPSFLVENLNLLRERCVRVTATAKSAQFGTAPAKLAHRWVPVWGIYSGDEVPEYVFLDSGGVAIDIFSSVEHLPPARLYDGISDNDAQKKVNPNIVIGSMITEWNSLIDGFAKNHSTPVSPLSTDSKRPVSFLPYTRVIQTFGESIESGPVIPRYVNPLEKFISNSPLSISRAKTVKGVKAIPPATYFNLHIKTVLSVGALGNDVAAALQYFILPSIRLNVTDGDFLTQNAYQTITGEIGQSSYNLGGDRTTAPNEAERIQAIGTLLCAGSAAADATNDTLTSAIKIISDHGQGLDFINSLLGGLSSLIPVVGPVISSLFN